MIRRQISSYRLIGELIDVRRFSESLSFLIPYTPLSELFGFAPLPARYILIVMAIVSAYVLLAEVVTKSLYRIVKY